MKEFRLEEKDYKMPTDWSEMTLRHYVSLAKLEETKSQFILGELYLLKVIESLCLVDEDDDLDELTLDIVNELSGIISFLQENPVWNNISHLNIEGVDYVFPSDLNKLTMGEYISMKTFQENSASQAEAIPYVLSIILRPGKKIVNEETGEEKWVQDKFTASNIEYRKELFMDLPVFDLMGPVSFFLSGKELSTNNTKDFTEEV
jgi:hypothetical protein